MAEIRHLGLIPDGTRRWARQNSYGLLEAYKITMVKICDFIRHYLHLNINQISTYLLSTENLKRDESELIPLLQAELYFARELLPALSQQTNARIAVAGDIGLLPDELGDSLTKAVSLSQRYRRNEINFLIAYSPDQEIRMAVDKGAGKFHFDNLQVADHVDVVVRTAGGPCLLSNFLPLQCGYAQIAMLPKLFNDCSIIDFDSAIKEALEATMLFGT